MQPWNYRRRALSWISGVAFVVATAAFLGFLALGPDQRLDRTDKLASVASLLLTMVGLAVSVSALTMARRAVAITLDPSRAMNHATGDLARMVSRQWEQEAAARGLLPEPLHVRWSSTTRPVTANAAEVIGDAIVGARPTRLKLHGDVMDVARLLRDLPVPQIAVIGRPGAGKTTLAVLLTVSLLRVRAPDEPVPLLVNLARWDPRQVHLDAWLAEQIIEGYPALAANGPYGPDAAARIIDRGGVLPILDGLDEMPTALHAMAARALTEAMGRGRPTVVTCRSEEYQAAIAAAGAPLGRAAVVELEPVGASDIAEYLPAGQVDGSRWAPVVAHLRAHPDGPLARVLSTPLMAYLARMGFSTADAEPAELLAHSEPGRIETRLLDLYLSAVYSPVRPARYGGSRARFPCTIGQARRWLGFMALHMTGQRTRDLEWWLIIRAVPQRRPLVGAICGAGFGGVFAAGVGLGAGPGMVASWLGFALGFGPLAAIGDSRGPRMPASTAEVLSPHSSLRNNRNVFLAICVLGGGLMGFAGGVVVARVVGDPTAWARAFALSLVVGLAYGLAFNMSTFAGTATAWGKFTIARCWLGLGRHMPWRVMSFLEDGYRRGVLRRIGATYQFRHVRLQEHLARAVRGT